MTNLQFIITMAVIAFAILTTCVVGVIFSVRDMLKQLEEKTPEDQQPAARYEYDIYVASEYSKSREIMDYKGADGWRVVNMGQCVNGFIIIFERENVKEVEKK